MSNRPQLSRLEVSIPRGLRLELDLLRKKMSERAGKHISMSKLVSAALEVLIEQEQLMLK